MGEGEGKTARRNDAARAGDYRIRHHRTITCLLGHLLPHSLLTPAFHALVPCAGVGTRAGSQGPKQYARVAGQPMVQHTLDALAQVPRLQTLMVVLHPDDTQFETELPTFPGLVVRVGGSSRARTVVAGLEALQAAGADATDWVLVHDAARCLLRPAWVEALIDACEHDPVGGLLALPVADTLKHAVGERVQGRIERTHAWQAQTPQMFRLGPLHSALLQALAHSPEQVTDEASAMESLGHSPLLVRGTLENFKVTYPVDFELAERLLRTRPS